MPFLRFTRANNDSNQSRHEICPRYTETMTLGRLTQPRIYYYNLAVKSITTSKLTWPMILVCFGAPLVLFILFMNIQKMTPFGDQRSNNDRQVIFGGFSIQTFLYSRSLENNKQQIFLRWTLSSKYLSLRSRFTLGLNRASLSR